MQNYTREQLDELRSIAETNAANREVQQQGNYVIGISATLLILTVFYTFWFITAIEQIKKSLSTIAANTTNKTHR